MDNGIHKCELKKGKMWELLIGIGGILYCKRCKEIIPKNQVEPKVLCEIEKKYMGKRRVKHG